MKPDQKFIVTFGSPSDQEEQVMNLVNSGWRIISVTARAITGGANNSSVNGGFGILFEKDKY